MFAHNRPGKGDASRAFTENDSPGSSTRGEVRYIRFPCFCLRVGAAEGTRRRFITIHVSRRRRERNGRLPNNPHYCTDPDVTWGNGRRHRVPSSCALLADLQSVHGLRCCCNIARTRKVSECLYSLCAWLHFARSSRGEMYTGHGRLCVCLPVAAFPRYCTDADVT